MSNIMSCRFPIGCLWLLLLLLVLVVLLFLKGGYIFMKLETINYYNENAEKFNSSTYAVDFTENQNRFLNYLNTDAIILDFGCGSGRDTKYFLKKGFEVHATDGSSQLCEIASKYTGIQVKQQLFGDLDVKELYDGVWACASILHLPLYELSIVMKKIGKALKENGVLYTSFKYGEFEGMRNGRYFTDMTENKLKILLDEVDAFVLMEHWISADARVGRDGEKWTNIILKKK